MAAEVEGIATAPGYLCELLRPAPDRQLPVGEFTEQGISTAQAKEGKRPDIPGGNGNPATRTLLLSSHAIHCSSGKAGNKCSGAGEQDNPPPVLLQKPGVVQP